MNRYYPITPLPDKPEGRNRMPLDDEEEDSSRKSRKRKCGDPQEQPAAVAKSKTGEDDDIEYCVVVEKIPRNHEFKPIVLDTAPVPHLHYFCASASSSSASLSEIPDFGNSLDVAEVSELPSQFDGLFLSSIASEDTVDADSQEKLTYTDPKKNWKIMKKMPSNMKIHVSRAQVHRDDKLPWSAALQPKEPKDMVWNEHNLQRIRGWLNDWKELQRRQKLQDAKNKANVKANGKKKATPNRKTRRRRNSDSDESSESENEDPGDEYVLSRGEMLETYDNPLIIVGANGTGKTTLIQVAALAEDYMIIEQGPETERNQQTLLKLKEATCSHRMAMDIRSMFGKLKPSLEPPSVVSKPEPKKPTVKPSKARTSMDIRNMFNKTPIEAVDKEAKLSKMHEKEIEIIDLAEDTPSKKVNEDAGGKSSTSNDELKEKAVKVTRKGKEFSVLVFEDIDGEQDSEIWKPLLQLLEDSRIPIILSVSDRKLAENRFTKPLIIDLPQIDAAMQSEYLEACMFGLTDAKLNRKFISSCVEAFDKDFRRCMNQLQFALADKPTSISLKDVLGDFPTDNDSFPKQKTKRIPYLTHPWIRGEEPNEDVELDRRARKARNSNFSF
ncbi:hypothetical protein L596_014814 [Steinernema carpocapsae]|uniref:AAA+ ATPase domain-containing protein n=1 Tax=Steinernema carpocapsae TaxID=34508 RepID=A0A4U5NDV7_STECR|nr:hypothetical protein L596_014814 [Steinernema carpocapsae]